MAKKEKERATCSFCGRPEEAVVLQPAREFSYIMYGLRRGLEVLMAGNRLPVNRVYQDEEMFI